MARKKLPNYPIPVLRLARLAVEVSAQGQEKKAQETSQKDIKLARKRYKDLMRTQPEELAAV